ncbi:MAG: bifunctional diguanylate cyclase/phosphodiesterase, partial [Burkholderiales bacterium]|nr:bifunctional diguanylate cyclase/phosphodiesterase [Burkholderiales bacterium]
DGFKSINDTHSHEVGDRLLIALAQRMNEALRQGDTLARIGGDEFVGVLVDLPDEPSSVPVLQRLLQAAALPVDLGELKLQVSASIGVSVYPQAEEVDADQLVRQADQAMYQAKQSGKNRFHIFDAEQERSARGRHETLAHLQQALVRNEFVLFYQPKVNMGNGKVLGAEALIRWRHPERGLLAPAMFLPIIENHPLSIELGEWVIDTALSQIEVWRAQGLSVPVSVNIGALQLQHPDFVPRLRDVLAQHPGVRPGELELEILETSALADFAAVSQAMAACQDMGVHFSVDDFGTGYSSLTYLKQLPVQVLKIDQSFVRDMLDDPDDLAILKGVLGLAEAFNRQVIAEGVETPAHGEQLLRLGCLWGQGYAIARPMPAHELPHWISTWTAPLTWQI